MGRPILSALRLCLLLAAVVLPLKAGPETDGPAILSRRCEGCHHGRAAAAGLDLTSRESALKGGRSGAALAPGRPTESLIWKRVSAGEMPPAGALDKLEAGKLRAWIESGAPWTKDLPQERRAGPDWWSLQPLTIAAPPSTPGAPGAWSVSSVDRWVFAKLAAARLQPSPRAEARALIRRVSFDLTGLPPAPEEVEAFVNDSSPQAYEKLIDRLLASPHYGERWARHWLDIVRFSESEGFERDLLRDYAWRYRDYVIDSFNRDKPYDLFAKEQIAGDVLEPQTADGIVATGLLVAGPTDAVGLTSAVARERESVREDQLEDMVGVVSQTFLGMTANCARCHDHRFDPIPQRDYYRIRTALAGVWQPFADPESIDLMPDGRTLLTAAERKQLEDRRAALSAQIEETSRRIGAALQRGRDAALGGKHDDPLHPFAVWSLDHDTRDTAGDLHASPNAKTVLEAGRLRVKDDTLQVSLVTRLLQRDIRERTLEAWLTVRKKPDQTGVSVFRILNKSGFRGAALDGIQYAGGDKRQWQNTSTAGFRTESFEGPPETAEPGDLIQLVLVYDASNSIRLYRNGRAYGRAFHPDPSTAAGLLQTYAAGDANLRITASQFFDVDEARLYDRALSESEVALSYRSGVRNVAEEASLAQLAPREREQVANWKAGLDDLERQLSQLPTPAKAFAAAPRDAGVGHVLARGDVDRKGEVVSAGGLSCVSSLPSDFGLAPDAPEADRRRALANWIASPRNPLFARVMVNRLWHYHFGTGLAESPNDLGFNGGRPSHPELLDWLAGEFIRGNWSVKKLHKLILLSETYRQSSQYNAAAAAQDAGNRLLWRFSPRRLEAEAVRDAMLAVSGALNPQLGGESFRPFAVRNLGGSYSKYEPADSAEPNLQRRTVYRMAVNTGGDPLLDSLDCPVPSVKSPKRPTTTTALQALSLMNNAQSLRLARAFADRVRRDAGEGVDSQIERAFRLALGRGPNAGEKERSRALVAAQRLESLTWGLINSSEFLYVE